MQMPQRDIIKRVVERSVNVFKRADVPAFRIAACSADDELMRYCLLYTSTAVTRARRMVMIVGRESAIDQMIANVNTRRRYSALCWRLQQVMNL